MAGRTKHLHDAFPDFTLAESDRKATQEYREMVRSIEKRMEKIFGKAGTAELLMKVGDVNQRTTLLSTWL